RARPRPGERVLRERPARARDRARRAPAPGRDRRGRGAEVDRAVSAAAALGGALPRARRGPGADARRERLQAGREHAAPPVVRSAPAPGDRGGAPVSALPFHRFAERDPEALAVVDPCGERWPRGRLAALANGAAHGLRALGARTGEAVAIVSPNCAEYLAVHLAAVSAGLRLVPVNWHLARDELAFVLEDSGAAVIVAHERLGQRRLAQIREDARSARLHVSIGRAPGYVGLAEVAAGAPRSPIDVTELGRVMPYTSA